jgi:hypothetical protein
LDCGQGPIWLVRVNKLLHQLRTVRIDWIHLNVQIGETKCLLDRQSSNGAVVIQADQDHPEKGSWSILIALNFSFQTQDAISEYSSWCLGSC